MSKQLKLRRGTTAQHSTFTGAEGEVTVDTTKDTLVVHDGTTAGGKPLLPETNPSYTGTLTGGTGVVNFGSGQFYKDASGNVGIGTSSPTYELDIQNTGDVSLRVKSLGTGADDDANLILDAYGTGGEPGVYLRQDDTNVAFIEYISGDFRVSNETAGNVVFRTNGTERALIDSSGNVGIGNSAPTQKLDVTGSVQVSAQFVAPAGTLTDPAFSFTGDSNTGIYNQAAGAIGFVCNGNEEFRVDTTGQLWNTVNSQVGTDYATLYKGYLCRAWVNFNGTGTVAIRASGNVSSITDNGTGDYTVNFTTAMPDVNYSFVGGGQIDTSAADSNRTTLSARRGSGDIAVGSLRVVTGGAGASSSADVLVATVAVFR